MRGGRVGSLAASPTLVGAVTVLVIVVAVSVTVAVAVWWVWRRVRRALFGPKPTPVSTNVPQ